MAAILIWPPPNVSITEWPHGKRDVSVPAAPAAFKYPKDPGAGSMARQ